ncbi:sugar 3,4-ketoisomerase [Rufibacter soli]
MRNFEAMTFAEPYLLLFTHLPDATGTLVSTQDAQGLPFAVQRVFWVYGGPEGSERGGHAHRTTQEVLVALQGSVQVETETAQGRQEFELSSPTQGLYIPPYCWIKVRPSKGAVLCCMTSTLYEEADYIRSYPEFKELLATR